ncbi:hypothetical protein ACRAKI_19700 [Saccharothrix isguenensis]
MLVTYLSSAFTLGSSRIGSLSASETTEPVAHKFVGVGPVGAAHVRSTGIG